MAASRRDRFHLDRARGHGCGGREEGAWSWRRNARDVFPLFLLSAPVVDSRTIRETSGKHRVSFNWANFLSSLEKLTLPSLPRLLHLPSFIVLPTRFRGGGGGGGEDSG